MAVHHSHSSLNSTRSPLRLDDLGSVNQGRTPYDQAQWRLAADVAAAAAPPPRLREGLERVPRGGGPVIDVCSPDCGRALLRDLGRIGHELEERASRARMLRDAHPVTRSAHAPVGRHALELLVQDALAQRQQVMSRWLEAGVPVTVPETGSGTRFAWQVLEPHECFVLAESICRERQGAALDAAMGLRDEELDSLIRRAIAGKAPVGGTRC